MQRRPSSHRESGEFANQRRPAVWRGVASENDRFAAQSNLCGCILLMPLMTPLPFNLQVPIAGLVFGIVSWLLLDTFGRRFRSGSLRRGLLLSSRKSISLSCAL